MKALKTLFFGVVFVLTTTLCYADPGLYFKLFSGSSFKVAAHSWEAIVMTTVADDDNNPVEGAMVIAKWDDSEDLDVCHTNKRGKCRFTRIIHEASHKAGEMHYIYFKIVSVDKDGYEFKDHKNTEMIIIGF